MLHTQLKSWIDLQENLGNIHRQVLNELSKHDGLTNQELAEKLGWPINRVTGRVTELRRKGFVIDNGTKLNTETGKMNYVWCVKCEK